MSAHGLDQFAIRGAATELSLAQLMAHTIQPMRMGGFVGFCRALPALFRHVMPGHTAAAVNFQARTQRAKAPLQSPHDLLSYNAFYAARHYVVFRHLLQYAQQHSRRTVGQHVRLNVIDYGCGQGLASLALLEHLCGRQADLDIHLVEPSALALAAARQYIQTRSRCVRGTVNLHGYNLSLDALPDSVLQQCVQQPTVHLFSNVLDMARGGYFEISRLLQQASSLPGTHLFLAASPEYHSGRYGFNLVKHYFPRGRVLLDDCVTVSMPTNCNVVAMRHGKLSTWPRATSRMLILTASNSPRHTRR